MNKSLPISKLVSEILPQLDDPPAEPDIQARLAEFWRTEAGIIAPFTRPLIYRSGRLVIFCDSPAWATQLRHQSPSLLRQIEELSFKVSDLVIKITPTSCLPKDKKKAYKKEIRLSKRNAESIEKLSKNVSHTGLKASLQNLAKKRGS